MLMMSIQKIKNQKWLSFCLILGVTLLTATFFCQPMFQKGSLDKMIAQMFDQNVIQNNQYPAAFIRKQEYNYHEEEKTPVSDMMKTIDSYEALYHKYLSDIPFIGSQTILKIRRIAGRGTFQTRSRYQEICYMEDMLDHIQIKTGTDYATAKQEKDMDAIPCILSDYVLEYRNLVVGEKIVFSDYLDKQGKTLTLYVAGVFDAKEPTDPFWYHRPNESEAEVFVDYDDFVSICENFDLFSVESTSVSLLDYSKIDSVKAQMLLDYIDIFAKKDKGFSAPFLNTLMVYERKKASAAVMLWVMQLPILGMVLAFIYMVSVQIAESLSGEVAMQRSRGFSRFHVVRLYLAHTGILSLIGFLIGLPLGIVICKVSARTTDFLVFRGTDVSMYRFTPSMLLYGFVALLIGMLIILFPVLLRLKVSIVEQKAEMNSNKKMFWEKCFLDVLFLGLSIYLLYTYRHTEDLIRQKALLGDKMDPVVFLNTCLFMVTFGLFVFRLIHYLVQLFYMAGQKKWKPVSYVAFLQITRTFRKQCFISVFLILTVAMGLLNANVARTINRNKEERIEYANGADVILTERWQFKEFIDPKTALVIRKYIESDFGKYEELVKQGLCKNVAKVIRYPKTNITKNANTFDDCIVLGIDTKAFGNTAYLKPELNTDHHWYEDLNALAKEPYGIILSENLAQILGAEEGTWVTINGISYGKADEDKMMTGTVIRVVKNWPGYERYYYENGEKKERYLAITNYGPLVQSMEITPYEVWCDMTEGTRANEVYQFLAERNTPITSFVSIEDEIQQMKSMPDIQILNGMLTLSFLIALVLCGVGFLIYWVASIKSRELLFGVYRAMGLSVKEINRMLVYEHIFSTFLSVIAGGIVGMTATFLFIHLFGVVYLPELSNLDVYLYFEASDMIRLFVSVTVMILMCLLILRRQIKKLNITQALKLGEG